MNSSKGYDVFGKSVIKILNKHKSWKAIAIGNEPREKYNFNHDRFTVLDWVNHKKIIKFYKKSSISVVPSKWQEPFGRTAMESAAAGCATITSKKGGLPETFDNNLFLENVNEIELFKKIDFLIRNENIRTYNQKKNWKNVKHKIKDKVKKLDTLKNFFLSSEFFFKRGIKLKILHISTFDERNDHRLFNISIANKLSKGLIRNDHDVINFSYRNYLSKNFIGKKNSIINSKVLSISDNYRPNLVMLGHNNILDTQTIDIIRNKYHSKFSLWYEDALGESGNGPNYKNNLKLIERNQELIDQYYVTTHPDELKTSISKNKLNYLPIPVDENIENLKVYEHKNRYKDLFFALSHGVNFGKLKRGKKDEREQFINKLINNYPEINYNILGISNQNPKWNYHFYEELLKCKMALNLSRGLPLKYTSSNRIAALVGNGIYTFIDAKTKFNDYFNKDELGFYNNTQDLGKQIEYLLKFPDKINKYGKNGKEKYFKLFNSKKIAQNILDKIFT